MWTQILKCVFLFWTTWYLQKLDPFKLSQFEHSKTEAPNNIIFYKKILVVESTVSLSQRQ